MRDLTFPAKDSLGISYVGALQSHTAVFIVKKIQAELGNPAKLHLKQEQ